MGKKVSILVKHVTEDVTLEGFWITPVLHIKVYHWKNGFLIGTLLVSRISACFIYKFQIFISPLEQCFINFGGNCNPQSWKRGEVNLMVGGHRAPLRRKTASIVPSLLAGIIGIKSLEFVFEKGGPIINVRLSFQMSRVQKHPNIHIQIVSPVLSYQQLITPTCYRYFSSLCTQSAVMLVSKSRSGPIPLNYHCLCSPTFPLGKTLNWWVAVRHSYEMKKAFCILVLLWDVYIPHNSIQGFCLVSFLHKLDAVKLNGQIIRKRLLLFDWACFKKTYVDSITLLSSKDGRGRESLPGIDVDMEVDIANKVLNNLMKESVKRSSPEDILEPSETTHEVRNSKSRVGRPSIDPINKQKEEHKPIQLSSESRVDNDLERTLFITNLPFEIKAEEVKQRFLVFGDVQSFVPVLHKVTKNCIFKFATIDAADAAVSAANAASSLGITITGRRLTELENKKAQDHDLRNLYLSKEGEILAGTPAAEGVSESDMNKRAKLVQKKKMTLESTNFHVSKTRLIIYNLPKTMTENKLKALCRNAVKLLKDAKKGKVNAKSHARGVAFVEFKEHEHALVALRVLNNNPETFGPDHRPIVEFALDDIRKLRLRKRLQDMRARNPPCREAMGQMWGRIPPLPWRMPISELRTGADPREKITKRGNSKQPELLSLLKWALRQAKNMKKSRIPAGDELVDRLDSLIDQYRAKLSQHGTKKVVSSAGGSSGGLKRWFES
ncbi:unnamed protein product [Spirodela intermedia]|uniref:RRM domain-containing protein n=1 Tax=Spirodela intermedia TaxID=51605 RepID=A0A7I8J097_SPIIN|nr:unnamed protein product [Spirodela intermedia]CAA6662851.1 unnamed protein product [Spirodela intermedia]